MEPTPRYWFPAKKYGWGWGMPRTWEGLAVLLAYVAALVAPPLLLPERRPVWVAVMLIGTALLLWVCVKKGEPTGWRWGDR